MGALRYDYGKAPQHILDRVRRIEAVCDRHGVPIGAAALQFPLGHPAVASVLPGMRSAVGVAETVELLRFRIPLEFWGDLRAAGLLSVAAPLPVQG
jgi:D-threo-aldose 1-dehydrogenase